MALANLITGIDSSSDLEWGRSHPVADFAGGYTAFQSVEGGVYRFGQYESGNGLWLRLMGSLSTNPAAKSLNRIGHALFGYVANTPEGISVARSGLILRSLPSYSIR